MMCFECKADLANRRSFKVDDDLYCWPCVFTILRSHANDVRNRESNIDQKALADELKFITNEVHQANEKIYAMIGFEFPSAAGHYPIPCTDNDQICRRCGSHVGNHEVGRRE